MEKKQPTTYRDVEGNGYFAENCKTKEEAFELICADYPHADDEDFARTAEELKSVRMRKCLDCDSYWVDEDGTCGDCGEQRLSKRWNQAWFLET